MSLDKAIISGKEHRKPYRTLKRLIRGVGIMANV